MLLWIPSQKEGKKTGDIYVEDFSLKRKEIVTFENKPQIHAIEEPLGGDCVCVAERLRVPTLLASNTTVKEHNDSVVLICSTNAVSTQWFFNGMNLCLTERMKLSWNDRILTIDPVRREDAGNYQCEVSNPISSAESEPIELDVKY
ncbi:Carcinoembryonic antigen-related cell adhesion molecule 21 [Myotis brandtii]|uniref:Carcinoembryonic antigen-related cell adhesion molecule 21 n=1 Tax=Myotis brandtii TaxID=109478 RepID=S7NWR6_MYOBR|nr:Carcinoembryonic antigen-related cell adhesion molecule 21 [Myotis brandtii]